MAKFNKNMSFAEYEKNKSITKFKAGRNRAKLSDSQKTAYAEDRSNKKATNAELKFTKTQAGQRFLSS